jgi:hypothetical protein
MCPGEFSVSVVTPAYNVEGYLGDAIRSALEQSLAPLEIIVVDDGSTDRTGDVARAFGHRVRCIRQDNAGCAAARNHGIREAAGEFVAFLDADDRWLPSHLEEAARVLGAHPQLRWFCAAYEVRAARRARGRREIYKGPLVEGAYVNDYFRADLLYKIGWTGVMVIGRRALLEIGGFDETMRRGSDIDGWFRIGLRYPQIGYSRTLGAVYLRRGGSITGLEPGASAQALVTRLDKLERLAAEAGAAAVRRSRPHLLGWARLLVQVALQEGNRDALRAVQARYGDKLGLMERLLIPASRFVPRVALRRFLGVRARARDLLRQLRKAL